MIKITKLFFSPFKSMHMTETSSFNLIPNVGIEGDRVFCFTRFLDEQDALRFQEDRKARNIINFLSMKHSPILNHYHFSFEDNEISLFKLHNKLISVQDKNFSTLQTIVDVFKQEEKLEESKIFLLYNPKQPFFDYIREPVISLINVESLKDFNHKNNLQIDLERFRGNIYVEGLAPFEEFKWIDKTITINQKEFEVLSAIPRCKSTHYPYKSIQADCNVPQLLQQTYNHVDMGIYLRPTASTIVDLNSSIQFN